MGPAFVTCVGVRRFCGARCRTWALAPSVSRVMRIGGVNGGSCIIMFDFDSQGCSAKLGLVPCARNLISGLRVVCFVRKMCLLDFVENQINYYGMLLIHKINIFQGIFR